MEKHFTASVYLIKERSVLLIFHPKFQKWLPPGGHVEPNETPSEAARREVREETGFEIKWIRDEHLWIKTVNAVSFERPFACLAEEVPSDKGAPTHEHLDFIYLATVSGQQSPPSNPHPMRWVSHADINAYPPKIDMFPDTKEMVNAIFSSSLVQSSSFALD